MSQIDSQSMQNARLTTMATVVLLRIAELLMVTSSDSLRAPDEPDNVTANVFSSIAEVLPAPEAPNSR